MRRFLVLVALALLATDVVAEEIELVTGETLTARVLERSSGGLVLDHPILGRLYVGHENVKSVDGAAPRATPKTTSPATADAAPAAAPAAEPESPWNWSAELGFSGTEGNSETSDLHAAIKGLTEDDHKRWLVETSYARGESSGVKTKEEFHADVTRDWKLPGTKWFWFAGAGLDIDDFQPWNSRVRVKGGAGYQWIEEDDLNVRFRAGLNYTKENGTSGTGKFDDGRLEGLLGVEVKHALTDTQDLEFATTYYPDFENGGERRIDTSASWSVKLDTAKNMRLKIGIRNEYDSHRLSPFETNDLSYFAALLFEF